MSQTGPRDLEGFGSWGADGSRYRHRLTPNQPLRPLGGQSDHDDSSLPLYSIYSKIAKNEDNRIIEVTQKFTDGILIFSGLFAATVGTLLSISIPDLKPNSQDTSAFYLQNIYQLQVFGNPNVSHPSIPSTLANPPAFSPPKYAIWVNSLWFLSLVASLSCATFAMMVRIWVVHYTEVTWRPSDTPVERARTRTFFANGNPGPYISWGATNIFPAFLHLSLLLFIIGAFIYLFNINRSVFYPVVGLVGWMTFYYALATVMAFVSPEYLIHTPLSLLGLRIYLGISYMVFQVCSHIPPLHGVYDSTRRHYDDLSRRYSDGILTGKQREAKETVSRPSSEIDSLILRRILLTLDEDPALETFFDSIPGFCNSNLTVLPLSSPVPTRLRQALHGFLNRTFSSNLVSELVRANRLIICLNAAHAALGPSAVSRILDKAFNGHWDEGLQSVEIGHALRLWGHGRDHDPKIQQIVARIIAHARQRDDRWTTLVKETFGVSDDILRDSLAHGDSVLLSILIHASRQANHASSWTPEILSSLSKFDIRNTLPGLQHDFCALWNEIVQEARNQGFRTSVQTRILREIRHLYVALHQDTDAASTASTVSTDDSDLVLFRLFCNTTSHRPPSTTRISVTDPRTVPFSVQPGGSPYAPPHRSTLGGGAALRLAKETNIVAGKPWLFDQTAANEIEESSQAPTATDPAFPALNGRPVLTDTSSPGSVAAASQAVPSTAVTLSRPLEGNDLQDTVPSCAEQDIDENSPTVLTPVPTSIHLSMPVSSPPVLSKLLASRDPVPSVVGYAISSSSPPLPASPLQIANLVARPNCTTSCPINSDTLPRIRARGLVDDENNCFANAVFQLLVRCPPFWNLFRDLGKLMGRKGLGQGQESGGRATPLTEAMVKFLGEFVYKEDPSMTQQSQQNAEKGKARRNEEGKKENDVVGSFNPRYMYDAMKGNRRLKHLLDGQQQDAEVFLGLYLDALDEELVGIYTYISTASAPSVDELQGEGETQSAVGRRDYSASSVESPISRIFGGRSRSTIRAPNQPVVITTEDWRLLRLDIQPDSVHTIQDALAHVSQHQRVQVGQSSSSSVSQQVHIEVLPSVLVLRFKRLVYNASADGIVEINKPVQFAPELEIPPEIMAPIAETSMEPQRYKLYGVLYHRAESASGGHYTVDVLHPNGDSGGGEVWLHVDDEAVSAVRQEEVFGGHDNERAHDQHACMLFYCRIASAQT